MSPFTHLLDRYRGNSEPLRTERRFELILVLAILLLCLQLIYSGLRLLLFAGPGAVSPSPDSLVVGDILQRGTVSAEQSEEIQSRPLFWVSRRPTEQLGASGNTDEPGGKASDIKGVKLLGIFGSGESAGVIALVNDQKQRILQGEELEGWTVESVEPNRVVLISGERRTELVLLKGKVVTPVDAPPAEAAGNGKAASDKIKGNNEATTPEYTGLGFGGKS
jgi:hypothetical protein